MTRCCASPRLALLAALACCAAARRRRTCCRCRADRPRHRPDGTLTRGAGRRRSAPSSPRSRTKRGTQIVDADGADDAARRHRRATRSASPTTWKIGRKEVGDGLLIVVAKNDRDVRIEVAKTLEGAVPDVAAEPHHRRARSLPAFKAGDFAGGLQRRGRPARRAHRRRGAAGAARAQRAGGRGGRAASTGRTWRSSCSSACRSLGAHPERHLRAASSARSLTGGAVGAHRLVPDREPARRRRRRHRRAVLVGVMGVGRRGAAAASAGR